MNLRMTFSRGLLCVLEYFCISVLVLYLNEGPEYVLHHHTQHNPQIHTDRAQGVKTH